MVDKIDLEIYDSHNKKKYKAYVAKDTTKIKYMINYFNEFIKIKDIKALSIDLEFNKVSKYDRDVALIQINLEILSKKEGVIFVLDPKILNNIQLNILINLLTTKSIIKILHGGESLDIPYLLNQLFNNNITLIRKFLDNLYDTKYLCEYNHILNNEKKKCSIYDLYKEFDIITNKKFIYLSNIENITGPIYLVDFKIENITSKVLEYAVYDVLYLVSLFEKITKPNINFNKIIPEITRNIFFYKRIENKYFIKINETVNKYNNYFILINNENIKLNDFYYFVIYSLNNKIYQQLLNITYYKFFIEILYKYLIYIAISKKYTIYKEKKIKNSTIDDNLINKILFGEYIINFFNKFKKEIQLFI
jgi:hypothetical protein